MSEGRAATGYDHGYDGGVFYLELDLDPRYVEGFVKGALERIDEDDDGEEVLWASRKAATLGASPWNP